MRTFSQAQSEMLAYLKQQNWEVSAGLKVPHATMPGVKLRFYFKPQGIYLVKGDDLSYKNARSTFVDPRKLGPADLLAYLIRYAQA